MSPHGVILLSSLVLAAAGKMMFHQYTLWTVAVSALALPVGVIFWVGELPSPLGLIIAAPISLVGAILGVGAGGFLAQRWGRFRGST